MAQKNRANMLTDIVSNIYNNLVNFITGQNAQDRFVNLLDSSPNILSDASQANGYVSTDANNEMFAGYYNENISRADLITKLTANLAVGFKYYQVNDAVGGTLTLLVMADSNISLYPWAVDLVTGESGEYDITTDAFTPVVGSGNASITPITVAALTILQGLGTIETTTIYLVTDASPFVLEVQFKAANQNVTTGIIKDNTYAGTVLYTASTGVSTGGRISDANGNVWNGTMPSNTTLGSGALRNQFGAGVNTITAGTDFINNIFEARANGNVFGDGCQENTIKQAANSFTFGNNLQNTTIETGTTGADYTATPDYNFLYNNDHQSVIFYDGADNYHRHYDPANDRIVIVNMTTLAVTYIGGSGGTGDVVGPASAVNDNIAVFDTTTGKLIKDGGATVASKLDVAAAANYRLTVSDGSGNRGNASAITASRALKSDANGVPTHFDTATEPSLTELSYVKGVTSAIQTQFGAKQDTLVSATNIKTINGSSILGAGDLTVSAAGSPIANCTAGTAVTGTIANTYSKGLSIPANSRAANDAPQIDANVAKTGAAGNVTLRIYWNATNDLAGSPILIATGGPGAALNVVTSRIVSIEVANGTGAGSRVATATTSLNTSWSFLTTAATTLAIDWTSAGYIVVAVQNGSALDSSVCNMIKLH